MIMDGLSIGRAGTSRDAAARAASADGPEQAPGRGADTDHQLSGGTEGFAWETHLLAYECPLFARKFPANASAQVLTTFGKFVQSSDH